MNMKYGTTLLLVGTLSFISTAQLHASFLSNPLNKETTTWQNCNAGGCSQGGSATVKSDYAKTKYPIVLGHGAGGFSAVGPLQYWHGITEDLVSNGANVYVTQQAAFQSSEVRGEQLLTQVKQILAITGAQKVNLIGHSHGNQSIRYVAGLIPNNVASVTSVGGPAKGTPLADAILALRNPPVVGDIIGSTLSAGTNAFFSLVGVASGHYYDQDSLAALDSLSTAGAAKFNQKFPEGVPLTACGEGNELGSNGVRYYSWSGTKILTNVLDPIDTALIATGLLIPGESDGSVPKCSSHLGKVIRDNYAFNHFDEVNQVLGLVGALQDPIAPYRLQANRLKNLGL
ncbi:esterase/lipase family protein [Acinetobacter calcoaceticus]|uniref:esterase/lipase family protein n=1 Tax=Acinetobacter calcoaceticus TaxID=471 RepID=UPI0005F04B78|nr:triacylglycerol lipase [Acinetobacter calcoaceticus]